MSPMTKCGGAERMMFNIISSLRFTHKVRLVCTSDQQLPKEYEGNIDFISLNHRHAALAFFDILHEIYRFKPNHVFTISSGSIGWQLVIAKILLRGNFKVTVRCGVPPSETYNVNFKTKLLRRITRFAYKRLDLMIAQTEFMRQDLIATYRLPDNKVMVIRNIIDFDLINRRASEYRPLEIASGSFNIIAVGALYSVKGFDILIKSIADLISEKPNIKLLIIGGERYEKGYKSYLQNLIDSLDLGGHVKLLGARDNPYPYFKNADLAVMSSLREGFPNVVLEALALETPVVATDCVDFSGVIYEGINGFVVKKESEKELRKGILKALDTEFDLNRYKIENFDYNTIFN